MIHMNRETVDNPDRFAHRSLTQNYFKQIQGLEKKS